MLAGISRRELLGLGALAAAAAAAGCGPRGGQRGGRGASGRVVVVGAGLAGLTVAHRLVAAGREVVVLEAQARVGGRVLTLREPFANGLYVEAGAKHVVAEPGLMALMQEVGVKLVKAARPAPAPRVVVRGGQRLLEAPDAVEADADEAELTEEERGLDFLARMRRYFGAAFEADPRAAEWLSGEVAAADGQSLQDYLTARGASARFIADMVQSIAMGEPASAVSAAWVIQQAAAIRQEIGWSTGGAGGRVVGGSDAFPRALAARLGQRVLLGAAVRRIALGADGVRVGFERAGKLEEITGARVVVTVHAPVLRSIVFTPALPAALQQGLAAVRVASATLGWAELGRRVWDEAGVAGGAQTDDSWGGLRDETLAQPGPGGILSTYASGPAARELAALGEGARAARLRALVERVHPGATGAIAAVVTKVWDEDPFAGGAYAWMPPGFLGEVAPRLERGADRLHLAGDYLSYRPGFMQGAVASAERAVAEVLAERG